MKKNGFTLIELLAVIVILAIIALIATPIVLNIIEDTKNSATLRSADFYLDAVELAIATETLKGGEIDGNYIMNESGNLCKGSKCLTVEVQGDAPDTGSTVTIANGEIASISLAYDNDVVIKNSKGNLVFQEPVCTLADDSGATGTNLGAKYLCKVKEEMEEEYEDGYTFYVLSNNLDENDNIISTNLILDRDIRSDGTLAVMEFSINPPWNSSFTTTAGPITIMQFLHNATKDWINVMPVDYEYYDRVSQGISEDNEDTGYISFISTNGEAVITPLVGDPTTIGTPQVPLRARLPIYISDSDETEVSAKVPAVNDYLFTNLDNDCDEGPMGYQTLSSCNNGAAWVLTCSGGIYGQMDVVFSVRPVITVEL